MGLYFHEIFNIRQKFGKHCCSSLSNFLQVLHVICIHIDKKSGSQERLKLGAVVEYQSRLFEKYLSEMVN